MAIPLRGPTGRGAYFITASTYLKQQLLQAERTARLFIEVLYDYRRQGKYPLHEFVVMPDHFHLLITPGTGVTLERAMQFILPVRAAPDSGGCRLGICNTPHHLALGDRKSWAAIFRPATLIPSWRETRNHPCLTGR